MYSQPIGCGKKWNGMRKQNKNEENKCLKAKANL